MIDDQHGPPIKVERPNPVGLNLSTNNTISSDQTADAGQSTTYCRQLHVRRAASQRLPVLDHGGRSDPWHYERPVAGYPEAAAHLLKLGLTPAPNWPALRSMWKSSSETRPAAQVIAERWAA